MGSPGFILKKSNDFVIANIKNIIVHILDDYGYYYGVYEHEDYIFISVNEHIGSNKECFVMYLFDNERREDNAYEIAMIESVYECEDILLKILYKYFCKNPQDIFEVNDKIYTKSNIELIYNSTNWKSWCYLNPPETIAYYRNCILKSDKANEYIKRFTSPELIVRKVSEFNCKATEEFIISFLKKQEFEYFTGYDYDDTISDECRVITADLKDNTFVRFCLFDRIEPIHDDLFEYIGEKFGIDAWIKEKFGISVLIKCNLNNNQFINRFMIGYCKIFPNDYFYLKSKTICFNGKIIIS